MIEEEREILVKESSHEINVDQEASSLSNNRAKKGNKCKQMLRVVIPHVGLYFFLFCYLLAGASLFAWMEDEADQKLLKRKFESIKRDYEAIADSIEPICTKDNSREEFRKKLFKSISKLSSLLEGRRFDISSPSESLPSRWSKTCSILYALSILTTTGYSTSAPVTLSGQCLAMAYGILGIPLMILAAVDIGRFLSHIVLKFYSNSVQKISQLMTSPKKDLIHHTIKILLPKDETAGRADCEAVGEEGEEGVDEEKPAVEQRLPLIVNATILLLFCCLGGILYLAAGGNKTFMEAFFVTFNLVANLTMSEMPNDLNHILTLIYIFVFVTFGVAVLSMCAELAAIELKQLFLKIHYFGRKINFKRKAKADTIDEVEVKELLKIIEEIRRKYPEKQVITSLDILHYMNEEGGGDRRDTIAFIPHTMEALRFADELDLEDKSVSRNDEIISTERTFRRVELLQLHDSVQFEEKFRLHVAKVMSKKSKIDH